MKHLFFLFLLPAFVAAQDGGISFTEQPFDALLAQAKAEDKLIFIDAYTTWCGPCKMMTAKVFPDSAVGAVYNERFINAKFDMEKGEGPGLAARYDVAAYPTYLFVNGDGNLVHKGLGYIPKPALLELADVAVSDRSLGALEARFDAGERDPEFLQNFAMALTNAMDESRADRVVSEYLTGQEDWSTPANLQLLLASPGGIGDPRMDYLIEHAAEIEAALGAGSATSTIQRALVNTYHREHRKRSLVAPDNIREYYETEAGPLWQQLHSSYALMYYERKGDMKHYLPLAMDHYSRYPSEDYTELNGVAWAFFENSDDPAQLAKAVEWAERSVELHPYYPNLDTLAWLYHKTGQQEKAEAAAHRAIEYAKADDLDYSDTQKIFQ
ncbi:thioredoxin family protein [Lewinella sp. IMCC34183]|uniref:thioredoxin family protein n=1 Tax=Lewinella sp. IMCC34183 TaxID=2248762 RepID=UPI000E254FEC|nr:thioredoxin domain-containing protein [Lewinella sp. IMCC34183]